MRRYSLSCAAPVLAMALLAATAGGAAAAPWARGYVVTAYEPAWFFGGNANFRKGDLIEPGSDCPKGSFADIDYAKQLLAPWRDAKAVDLINHPLNTELSVIQFIQMRALTFRGFRDDIDVYLNPFSTPDPGMQQVTGKIAEGFDLDGSARTGGFTSPDGQRGIDNAYYRAWGCLSAFRDLPYHATMSMRANDKMVEGLYTFVIRVSGNKDPRNDDDATLEIGFSPDHMIKGASGGVLGDYSFRLATGNEEYSRVKAMVKDGVIETAPVAHLHAPRFSWFPNVFGDADFHKGRLRLTIGDDGNVSGLIGGYRDWRDLYSEDHFTQDGATEEQRDHQDSMGMYYSLRRNADAEPDPKTGRNTAISIAYRFRAEPAFVVDPPTPIVGTIATSPSVDRQIALYKTMRATFLKAITTRQIQTTPAGSREGMIGLLVQEANGGWHLVKRGAAPAPKTEDKPAPKSPARPRDQQVRNGAPSAVATR